MAGGEESLELVDIQDRGDRRLLGGSVIVVASRDLPPDVMPDVGKQVFRAGSRRRLGVTSSSIVPVTSVNPDETESHIRGIPLGVSLTATVLAMTADFGAASL